MINVGRQECYEKSLINKVVAVLLVAFILIGLFCVKPVESVQADKKAEFYGNIFVYNENAGFWAWQAFYSKQLKKPIEVSPISGINVLTNKGTVKEMHFFIGGPSYIIIQDEEGHLHKIQIKLYNSSRHFAFLIYYGN